MFYAVFCCCFVFFSIVLRVRRDRTGCYVHFLTCAMVMLCSSAGAGMYVGFIVKQSMLLSRMVYTSVPGQLSPNGVLLVQRLFKAGT